jgi:hypothetical protein
MAQGRSPSGHSLLREIRYNEFRYNESHLYVHVQGNRSETRMSSSLWVAAQGSLERKARSCSLRRPTLWVQGQAKQTYEGKQQGVHRALGWPFTTDPL